MGTALMVWVTLAPKAEGEQSKLVKLIPGFRAAWNTPFSKASGVGPGGPCGPTIPWSSILQMLMLLVRVMALSSVGLFGSILTIRVSPTESLALAVPERNHAFAYGPNGPTSNPSIVAAEQRGGDVNMVSP